MSQSQGASEVLPPEYERYSYIESTGTQWIDTEIEPDYNTKIRCQFTCFDNNGSTYASPFGEAQNDGSIQVVKQINSNTVYAIFGRNTTDTYNLVTETYWYDDLVDLEISKDGVVQNGVQVVSAFSNNVFDTSNPRSIYLFATRASNSDYAQRIVKTILYEYWAYQNGVLVQHLVPVYKRGSGGGPGLYDLTRQKFLTNRGSGDFVLPE